MTQSLKKPDHSHGKWKQVKPVFITQNLIFSGMFINRRRLWAPKASHIPLITLSFLFSFFLHFSFFLSYSLSILLFVLLQSKKLILTDHSHAQHSFCFLSIQCSFCSFFFVLLPLVTHMPTHADPSREIIGVNLQSHAKKLHHALVLLIAAIVVVLRFGRSVEIGIHSNDLAGALKSASTATIRSGSLFSVPGTTLLEACFWSRSFFFFLISWCIINKYEWSFEFGVMSCFRWC